MNYLFGYKRQISLLGRIQTSQTGGQPYSDTTPYKVCEYSLTKIVPTALLGIEPPN